MADSDEDWYKKLAEDIEKDLWLSMRIRRHVIGVKYPVKDIDPEKNKPETDRGIW